MTNPPTSHKCLELHPSLSDLNDEQLEMLTAVEEDGDLSLLQELVTLFIDENEPRLPEVRQSCEARNSEELRRKIHFFAGSTANLGIQRVSRLCQQVEAALIENNFDAFDELPDALEREYKTGIAAIKQRAKLSDN